MQHWPVPRQCCDNAAKVQHLPGIHAGGSEYLTTMNCNLQLNTKYQVHQAQLSHSSTCVRRTSPPTHSVYDMHHQTSSPLNIIMIAMIHVYQHAPQSWLCNHQQKKSNADQATQAKKRSYYALPTCDTYTCCCA